MATLLLKRSLFKFTSACLGLDSEIVKIAFDHPNIDLADSFKAYDVRGIDEQTLNSDVALAVGFAFVEVTGVDPYLWVAICVRLHPTTLRHLLAGLRLPGQT